MEKNKLLPYGQNMAAVFDRIKHATAEGRWVGHPPLGPLGMYVTLKEEAQWATDVVGLIRKPLLTGFAITDAKDRSLLSKILKETRK